VLFPRVAMDAHDENAITDLRDPRGLVFAISVLSGQPASEAKGLPSQLVVPSPRPPTDAVV